jgi:hypothetical protein
VATTGNDSNAGTSSSPWKTIAKAGATAQAGDTVYFKGGVYNVATPQHVVNSGTSSAWISFKGVAGEKPIFDGTNLDVTTDDAIMMIEDCSYILVENMHFRNSTGQGISIYISDNVTVQYCSTDLTWKSGIGIWGDKMLARWAHHIKILNNVIARPNSREAPGADPNATQPPHESISFGRVSDYECAYNEVYGGHKEGIDSKGPNSRGKIHHNYIHDKERVAIYVDAWSESLSDIEIYENKIENCNHGISVASEDNQAVDDVRIHNNTTYNISRIAYAIGQNGPDNKLTNISFINNSSYLCDHAVLIPVGPISGVTIRNNIFYGTRYQVINLQGDAAAQKIVTDYNLIDVDPLWTDPTHGDFTLKEGSPAINAGHPDAKYNDADGSRNDQGAIPYSQWTAVTKPTAPSNLSAAAASSSSVDLTFTDNADNETGFNVNYRRTGVTNWTAKSFGASSGTGSVVATVSGLTAKTGYDFQVCAVNSAGSSAYTATKTATTLDDTVVTNGTTSVYECEILAKTSSDTVSTYTDSLASGGKWTYLAANAVGDYVEYTLNVSAAGTYDIVLGYKKAASRGVCQLKIDGTNQSATVNQSGSGWAQAALGSKALSAGNHTFRFQVTAANASSYALSCDVIKLTGNGGGTTNNPPSANAGSDITVTDTDNSGAESVTLDGSASTDDNGISSYTWAEGTNSLGTTQTLSASLSVGTHTITLTVKDAANQTATDTVVVTVNAGSSTTAIADDFESGSFSGGTGWAATSWTTTGPSWQMPAVVTANIPTGGSGKCANLYRDGAMERAISLSGAKTLTYDYKTVGLDSGESAVCEVKTGTTWTVKKTYTTNTSGSDSVALTGSETAIRFRCKASKIDELMSVDDIEIK